MNNHTTFRLVPVQPVWIVKQPCTPIGEPVVDAERGSIKCTIRTRNHPLCSLKLVHRQGIVLSELDDHAGEAQINTMFVSQPVYVARLQQNPEYAHRKEAPKVVMHSNTIRDQLIHVRIPIRPDGARYHGWYQSCQHKGH